MRFFFELILYFTVFSFCGWVSESIICSITEKKLINRGFLVGPFIPVYGFGGLIMVIMLNPLKESPALLYITGVVLVTLLEYFTSVLMEKIFSIKLWDYSMHKFNFQGRIWLVSSLFFGLLGLLGVYIVNPFITSYMSTWSNTTVYIIGSIAALYFIADTITSSKLVLNIGSLLENFHEISQSLQAELESKLPAKGEISAELKLKYEQYLEKRRAKLNAFQTRILSSYPNLKSRKYSLSLSSFKEQIEELREERKQNKKNKQK